MCVELGMKIISVWRCMFDQCVESDVDRPLRLRLKTKQTSLFFVFSTLGERLAELTGWYADLEVASR